MFNELSLMTIPADSEELAWSIVNRLPGASAIVFDQDLLVLAAGGESLGAHGFDREAMLGRHLHDLLDPAAYRLYEPHYRAALRGEAKTFEAETVDGERIYSTDFSPLRSSTGEVIGGIASSRDVTEERRAQEAYREATELFETAFSGAPNGVALIGLDARFLRVNPALCEMLGRSEAELLGTTSRAITHPDDLKLTADAYAQVTTTGTAISVHKRYLRPDGQIVWADTRGIAVCDRDGQLSHIVAHFQDVTDRKLAEQRATQAQLRFETAFADAPIGMALVSTEGRLIKVNRTLCELSGYEDHELQELTFQEITHPDDLDADLDYVRQLLAGEADRYTMEKRYYTADGSLIWANLSVSLVRDESQRPLHFISQIEDISERKRMEASLQQLADHDPLTELWNRRRFGEELGRQIGRCHRYDEHAALLLLDLNGFKNVNDTHGHLAGDELLRAVAKALRRRLRAGDSVARLGGDEFGVLVPHVSPDEAALLAANLGDYVAAAAISVGDTEVAVSASIGVAALDARTLGAEDALHRADMSMYVAKASSPVVAKLDER